MTVRLIEGDVLSASAEFPENHFDVVLTSPPYYQQRRYTDNPTEIGHEVNAQTYCEHMAFIMECVCGSLKSDGALFVNLGDRYINGCQQLIPARFAIEMIERGFVLRNEIIWAKQNPLPHPATNRWMYTHEHVFFFTLGPRGYFFDHLRALEPAVGPDGRKVTTVTAGEFSHQHRDGERWPNGDKRNPWDVWTFPTDPWHGKHSAAFPRELVRRCLRPFVRPGAHVLDPFCGTGTTLLVARELGFDATGIDINIDDAVRRLELGKRA